jgi:hypothetical protein
MAQRIGSILAVRLLGRASMSPMNPEGRMPGLIGQKGKNSLPGRAAASQDDAETGPAAGIFAGLRPVTTLRAR